MTEIEEKSDYEVSEEYLEYEFGYEPEESNGGIYND
jgi:hypothetical protein